MEDAGGGRRTVGRGNAVIEDLLRETAGNCGSVVAATSLICGVCKGNWVQMRKVQGEAWWRQEAIEKQLQATLENIGNLREGGLVERLSHSMIRKGEGGRVCKSACEYGDKRRPGGRMNLCDRRRCLVGDRGRPGGRMNLCGSYGGD